MVAGVSARSTTSCLDEIIIDENHTEVQWQTLLAGFNVIVHCAARAHKTQENQLEQKALYQRTNVDLTVNMAKAAAAVGVNQIVFMSSIGVNGAVSDKPFTETDNPYPHNTYTESKLAAEVALLNIAKTSSINICIARLPLVYGEGVQANFLSLINVVAKKLPLPFGAIKHKRSLLGVGNLCDFVQCVITHKNVRNQIFLLADADITVPALINDIARGLNKKNWLIELPLPLLKSLLWLMGKSKLYTQLCEPLQINASKANKLLGWTPAVSYKAELTRTLQYYKEGHYE